MNLHRALIAAAALLLAATSHAHDCSGGQDGGMDATGNQCNEPSSVVAAAPAAGFAKPGVQAMRPGTATVRQARTAARTPNGSERVARAATAQGR